MNTRKYTVKNAAGLFYTGMTVSSTLTNARLAAAIRIMPIGTFSVEDNAIYSRMFALQMADGPLQLAALLDERFSLRITQRVPNHSREVL